ncbi:vegetative cell wall protein gp1-like [Monodon monoceros]|uniref:vegetative cell wall protein gp1-like n=1 Tax=Monodon monoceros TaxID=40151 RepID=UPI0010F56770|nr:vegetative cell wall protein gp1-like [Monodon monoceros]
MRQSSTIPVTSPPAHCPPPRRASPHNPCHARSLPPPPASPTSVGLAQPGSHLPRYQPSPPNHPARLGLRLALSALIVGPRGSAPSRPTLRSVPVPSSAPLPPSLLRDPSRAQLYSRLYAPSLPQAPPPDHAPVLCLTARAELRSPAQGPFPRQAPERTLLTLPQLSWLPGASETHGTRPRKSTHAQSPPLAAQSPRPSGRQPRVRPRLQARPRPSCRVSRKRASPAQPSPRPRRPRGPKAQVAPSPLPSPAHSLSHPP